MKLSTRLSHAWNAFIANEHTKTPAYTYAPSFGMSSSTRLDKRPLRVGTERTILASIYNRIAIDVAAIEIRHARVDKNGDFVEYIKSDLNTCLEWSANKDQTSRAFLMDYVLSMFDEGTVAIVPVDTSVDITKNNSYDIQSLRVGRITNWMPDYIGVELYNDRKGLREELTLPKSSVCIIENPLYQVMNEPNSTLQRLRHKLALLDVTDDKQNSDKLNMIIQLPYVVKSKAKLDMAEERRKQVEMQLTNNKYGIAYIDSTEKIIQLGQGLENHLIEQIEYLTNQLYAQLGITPEVFSGNADERTMLNYYNRTIEPIVSAFVDEANRKFLTKTARTQGQKLVFYRNPFALVTVDSLADLSDRLTRNEVLSSNEFRAMLGYGPVNTERANELLNKNINPVENSEEPMGMEGEEPMGMEGEAPMDAEGTEPEDSGFDANGAMDSINNMNSEMDEADLDSMSEEELEAYLKKLQSYGEELDTLEEQVNG